MRPVTCYIYQNNGTTTPGNLCTVTNGYIEDLAEKSQQVDGKNNLTKVTPGDMTVKIIDPDGYIWRFVQEQLTLITGITTWDAGWTYAVGNTVMNDGNAYQCLTAGIADPTGTGPTGTATSGIVDNTCVWGYIQPSGLLPPWIEIFVGGTRVFLGNIDPSRLVLHQSADDNSIELAAWDWSMGLSNTYLGSPAGSPWIASYQYVKGNICINGGSSYACVQSGTSAVAGGPIGVGSAITDGTVLWTFLDPTWLRSIPPLALAPAANAGTAQSMDAANYLDYGQYLNYIFAPNPCAWMAPGTILTMSQPVLVISLPGAPADPKDHDGGGGEGGDGGSD